MKRHSLLPTLPPVFPGLRRVRSSKGSIRLSPVDPDPPKNRRASSRLCRDAKLTVLGLRYADSRVHSPVLPSFPPVFEAPALMEHWVSTPGARQLSSTFIVCATVFLTSFVRWNRKTRLCIYRWDLQSTESVYSPCVEPCTRQGPTFCFLVRYCIFFS